MKRLLALVAMCLSIAACGSSSTSPTPTQAPPVVTPPAAATFTLSGSVTSSNGVTVSGATVKVTDGPNAGKSATTSASGSYSLAGLVASGMTVSASATNYTAISKAVTIAAAQTLDFQLIATPFFEISGTGNMVFDLPATVARVRIVGTYTGLSSNFIVTIGGRLLVNEIIGTSKEYADISTVSEGTYLTTGGVVEITDSSGVFWIFTEVR